MRLIRMLLICGAVAAPTSGFAAESTAKQTTPLSLPGAETHIYRVLRPESLRLHVFKPKDWKATDQRPAFVWFFGGGWTRGTPENAADWARWAARQGFVGIAPDYRVKDRFGTSPLESVADGRAAVRWIEDHATELGLDPQRVVVGGNSAGAHVALWAAIQHSPPGSSDSDAPKFRPLALILTSAVSDTSKASGYTPTRFGENAQALSPIHNLDAKMPPVLAFHGDADQTVPQAQALALRMKLRATGNVCEFVSVPGGSHNFATDQPEWREKTRALTEEFLRRQKIWPVSPAAP